MILKSDIVLEGYLVQNMETGDYMVVDSFEERANGYNLTQLLKSLGIIRNPLSKKIRIAVSVLEE